MDKPFVDDITLIKSMEFLGRCKCDVCQKEKKKREEFLEQRKKKKTI